MKSFNIFNLPNPSRRIGLGVYSASNRSEYQKQKKKKMVLGTRARLARKSGNFTAICEPTV
jgi:hypothetical protein